jgi:hypothetical protein
LERWKAILPLTEEIVGLNGKQVNPFHFLEDDHPDLVLNKFAIRFDASRWPPTNDGRQALKISSLLFISFLVLFSLFS